MKQDMNEKVLADNGKISVVRRWSGKKKTYRRAKRRSRKRG